MNTEIHYSPGAGLMTNVCVLLRRAWRVALIVVCMLTASSCNLSDTGPSAYLPQHQYFAVLALEHHAINLSMTAPYDTVTLHTTRLMGDGSAVPGDVTYSVSTPDISVTNGVLKGERPVARAVVRVTLTHGTITRTDSAVVSVIADAPDRLRDFGLRLPAGDSAKISAGWELKTIPLLRESESGSNLSTLLVSLVSSDSTVAQMTQSGNNVTIVPTRPGRVVLSSSTFAFGVTWRDSLVFTVGWPLQVFVPIVERFTAGSLAPTLRFEYQDITVGLGGCVLWDNEFERDIDVRFDDSTHVVAPVGSRCAPLLGGADAIGGNIAPWRKIPWDGDPDHWVQVFSPFRARGFSGPGVFPYQSMLFGTGGLVRVCDERNDTTCAPVRLGGWY